MSSPVPTELDRIRYWQGQRLRSRDFRDQIATEAQLRWWHDRALHNAFGVRYGFTVEPVLGVDSAVEIGCGLAYDCFGRELILQKSHRLNLPVFDAGGAGRVTLLAHYKETKEFRSKRDLSGVCAPSPEAPGFVWKRSSEVQLTDGVPIARMTYESTVSLVSLPDGLKFPAEFSKKIRFHATKKLLVFKGTMSDEERKQLTELSPDASFQQAAKELFEKSQLVPVPDSTFSTPLARALARPRVGSGMTVPGHTAWETWSERVFSLRRVLTDMPLGVQVTVDTSAAGFTETPRYFAWLEGSLWDRSNVQFFPAPFAHIDDATASAAQFRFRLWMPNLIALIGNRARLANQSVATEFLNFAQSKNLYVCWLGVQCAAACAGCGETRECKCETGDKD